MANKKALSSKSSKSAAGKSRTSVPKSATKRSRVPLHKKAPRKSLKRISKTKSERSVKRKQTKPSDELPQARVATPYHHSNFWDNDDDDDDDDYPVATTHLPELPIIHPAPEAIAQQATKNTQTDED